MHATGRLWSSCRMTVMPLGSSYFSTFNSCAAAVADRTREKSSPLITSEWLRDMDWFSLGRIDAQNPARPTLRRYTIYAAIVPRGLGHCIAQSEGYEKRPAGVLNCVCCD